MYAQKSSQDAFNQLFGSVASDSIAIDLQAMHVKSIRKIQMNDAKNEMTVRLDKNGNVCSFQHNKSFVVDSLVYDNSGKLLKYFILANGTYKGYKEYSYKDDVCDTVFWRAAKGKKAIAITSLAHTNDTGIVMTITNDGNTTVTKTYNYNGVDYTLLIDFDKEEDKEETRCFYTVYTPSSTKQGKKLVAEYGEMEYVEGIRDTILTMMENGDLPRTNDSVITTSLFVIAQSKDASVIKKIVEEKFPSLKNYLGKKQVYYRYKYNTELNKVEEYWDFMLADHFIISYNNYGRATQIVKNTSVEKNIEYGKNGLPVAIIVPNEPWQKEIFEYEFYR